jgi:hypothetical protein
MAHKWYRVGESRGRASSFLGSGLDGTADRREQVGQTKDGKESPCHSRDAVRLWQGPIEVPTLGTATRHWDLLATRQLMRA